MWQIRRIYFAAIGTPDGRFVDLIEEPLNLANDRGKPLDSILWLRNGGGKSTIMALVGAIIRPGRNDFLSSSERRNDAGRHLEDYVLGPDTAHVAVEWSDGPRRLVTGAVYEWADRIQPADPTASHDRLNQRWYSFFPDGDRAELPRLPFKVAGRQTHQEAFCTAVRALPAAAEPVVARTQSEWERTLAARGIDPDLWRTILQMNESEGGIEHQFLFADADDFVEYLLRLIIDPEIPNGVAKILGAVIGELAGRNAVEADLRFCSEAVERLTELDGAWRGSSEASELVRLAAADARALRGSLVAAAEIAGVEILEAQAASEEAAAAAGRHRAAADAARDTGNEYARLAAVIRERAVTAKVERLTADQTSAGLERDAWKATPLVVEGRDLTEQRTTLTETMRATERDAQPIARRRAAAAGALAAGLETLSTSARTAMIEAKAAAIDATAAAGVARAEHKDALREVAIAEAALGSARRAVERFETALAAARREGILGPNEAPVAAAEQLATTDERDALREDELRSTIEETQTTIARERAERDPLVLELERTRADARVARTVRDGLVARRDALATDPRMAVYLPAEADDLVGMGRVVREAIADGISRADSGLIDLALEGTDDARALAAIERTNLLPPTPDLARAAEVLERADINAVTGWTYLADAVLSSDRRLAAFLAAPELAAGLLVQVPTDLPRAREALAAAELRPTSLIALGTTAELHEASEGPAASRFAVFPNDALFDRDSAADEHVRRTGNAERRLAQSQRLQSDRERDRNLHDRLVALLAEMPPERLPALAREIEALDAAVATRASTLTALDARIADATARGHAADVELRTTGERRRRVAQVRARLDALVTTEAALAPDHAAIAALPAKISAAKTAAATADEAERAENEKATAARLRSSSLTRELDGYAEQSATLPGDLDPSAAPLPSGWSLDVLSAAWHDADEAWTKATTGSEAALKLASLERQERRNRGELAALDVDIRRHAERLLATPDGQSQTARSRATQAAEEAVLSLSAELGEARSERKTVHAEVERLGSVDRPRHRVVDEPATVEEALELERVSRAEQEVEVRLRTEADERARIEERRTSEAKVRASGFADQANTIEVATDEGVPSLAPPFGGTLEEARAQAREVSRSLTALRKDEDEARAALGSVANRIVAWAGHDEWALVKPEVRSQFRTPDVAAELGPSAARFRDDEIELRRAELLEHLQSLDKHRANVVNHGVGMVRQALRSLARFSALSKLPRDEDLGGWSEQHFIEVAPKTAEERDEAVMRDRVGRAVDRLIKEGTASISGTKLLWEAVHEVVGPAGFRARVMKPSPTFSTERISVDRMQKWSGGEKVTMALLLFVTVAKLRAANRGKELAGAGALILDNPLGKANYVLFLDLQKRVARSAGVQLVFLTGVGDMKAVGLFPCVIRMKNKADRGRRRGYVVVDNREVHEEEEIKRVTAARVYQLADEPSLSLV